MDLDNPGGKIRPVLFGFLGWSAIGLVFSIPGIRTSDRWVTPLLLSFVQWWSWGLIALLIAQFDGRLPFTDAQVGRRLLAHIPGSLVLTSVYLYVQAGLRALFGVGPMQAVVDPGVLLQSVDSGMFLWVWMIYWMILGGWLAKQYQERLRRSELQRERTERLSTQAQLRSLRLQIDPHFLFNALNAISSEVEADPVSARNMIEHLGNLLRLTLDTNDRQLVPLFEELSFLDHYLAIQRIRFGDRLRFEQVIDEDVRHVLVPSMTIQPLVENSIRHGLSQRAKGGLVRVAARRCDEQHIRITVEDDGVGLPADWSPGKSLGLGLSITAQRLAALYPRQDSVFDVRRRAGGGTEVEMRLPIHPGEGTAWKAEPRHA
uniref:histidine kinase n=1 Tax=Solibacter usitatus (strain Ellin6076) TaxID=234267 RepID=Q028U8_SOLUE